MEAIWNRMQLERPPNATCYVERHKFDASAFLLTLDKIIKDITSQELLHKEAAILSRLIYRMKRKFRNDKGVKSMSKINKVLLKYLSLSLEKEYENLKSYVEIDEKYITLSSKQMVEYVLVKTQGFAKLMLRLEEVSKHAAYFLKCRISLGHAWSTAITAYAVVSRIWILSRYLVKKACTWYNDLYQYLYFFEFVGLSWLPKDYELTNDLKSWLSVPWIDNPISSIPSDYGLKNTMFKLITPREYDSDEDLDCDIQDYNKETKSENTFSWVGNKNAIHVSVPSEIKNVVSNDDAGEIIDRHTFNLKYIQNTSIADRKEHKKFTKIGETKGNTAYIKGSNRESYFDDVRDEFVTKKKKKNPEKKLKNLMVKNTSKGLITFDDVNNISDLIILLNKESYHGLDKLKWNMIRNKGKRLLDKLEICSDGNKQSIPLKKIMKRIKNWIA
ncbi:nucleolus and neural progenitor protein [Bombus flavifrons]|uniref:nucleolus and neural progenitor protein n=1 Tax=Bombus flavifrons TaxID=103934 RepID=UPI0037040823